LPIPTAFVLFLGLQSAVSPFTGTWLADLSSQSLPDHDDVYLVDRGLYRCDSCEPPRAYAADGRAHPVPGDPNVATESVTLASPRAIVTRIVGPALVRETRMTVSRDGRTARYVSIDRRPGVAETLRSEYLARRVAPAPPGAHPVSGSWRGVRYVSVPARVRTTELAVAGDSFTYSVPIGVSYSATIGGSPVTVQGPYGGRYAAAVRRLDASTLVETRSEQGRPVFERRFRLSADGRALEIATTDLASGATFRIIAHRAAPRRRR
jgi:hypothetical protein